MASGFLPRVGNERIQRRNSGNSIIVALPGLRAVSSLFATAANIRVRVTPATCAAISIGKASGLPRHWSAPDRPQQLRDWCASIHPCVTHVAFRRNVLELPAPWMNGASRVVRQLRQFPVISVLNYRNELVVWDCRHRSIIARTL